ncbi:hypothetical protein MAR_022791 [Mya arenaria]|uniref:Uncharacterized protein n=1 Tax=Mya arenaria TaxID=6604 RepID=A0ABY7DMN1_MYAAR|nr:hypothetical protein MAR_022791 [Mya arenaria]
MEKMSKNNEYNWIGSTKSENLAVFNIYDLNVFLRSFIENYFGFTQHGVVKGVQTLLELIQ